jgi:hypothetical protein
MEINLNLGLVSGQFEESNIEVDVDFNVAGVLGLSGVVDDEWVAAFDESGPADAPWKLVNAESLRFGPIPVRELAGYLATLRSQINEANTKVEVERHRRAMAEYLDAEERARAHRQAIEALGNVFGRRLSAIDLSSERAA